MTNPVWPTDFRRLYSEGATYWWWSPDTGPGYDGTWPVGTEPPSGLMVTCAEAPDEEDPETWYGEEVAVSWEYGPESESGPYVTGTPADAVGIQIMIDGVMSMLAEERACAGTSV